MQLLLLPELEQEQEQELEPELEPEPETLPEPELEPELEPLQGQLNEYGLNTLYKPKLWSIE